MIIGFCFVRFSLFYRTLFRRSMLPVFNSVNNFYLRLTGPSLGFTLLFFSAPLSGKLTRTVGPPLYGRLSNYPIPVATCIVDAGISICFLYVLRDAEFFGNSHDRPAHIFVRDDPHTAPHDLEASRALIFAACSGAKLKEPIAN